MSLKSKFKKSVKGFWSPRNSKTGMFESPHKPEPRKRSPPSMEGSTKSRSSSIEWGEDPSKRRGTFTMEGGGSGSPVLDSEGKLIGVINSSFDLLDIGSYLPYSTIIDFLNQSVK